MSGWIGLKYTIPLYDEQVTYTFELMDGILTLYCDDIKLFINEKPSIHELQNLYYCLCGEELIPKP